MNPNLKEFLKKTIILALIIFVTRVIIQFPIDYFHIDLFSETQQNKGFSKIDGLKIVIMVSLFFGFFFKDRISKLIHQKRNYKQTTLTFIIAQLFVIAYYEIRYLSNIFAADQGVALYTIIVAKLMLLAAAFFFFALCAYGINYCKTFYAKFRKELIITAIIAFLLYHILILFQSGWMIFSEIVTIVLFIIFTSFYHVRFDFGPEGPLMKVNDFIVRIGETCSGIDSMLLFVLFFLAIFALDHKKIIKKKFFIAFILGFIGVYFVNIARLFLLMLIGVHISADLAVGLFHTNAGWIFFVIYFLGYYWFARKFFYVKE